MKYEYDCELIQDILPLYKENAVREKSRLIVDKHLSECPSCRQKLNELKQPAHIEKATAAIETNISKLAYKIKCIRLYRLSVFSVFSLLLLSFLTTWFGHTGINEVQGITEIYSPTAVFGIVFSILGIWLDFKSSKLRTASGLCGAVLLFLSEVYSYILYACGSTCGLNILFFNISIPSFSMPAVLQAISSTHIGFYLSFIMTVLFAAVFIVFSKKLKYLST